MLSERGKIVVAASDLAGHLYCRHRTVLDRAVALGERPKPRRIEDVFLETLQQRGAIHEAAYLDHLRAAGRTTSGVEGDGITADAVERTRALMAEGADVIVQGAFRSGRWQGKSDVLLRVEKPSRLWPWSYEVVDTKLARETKGGTILQLCLYSDLLEEAQGAPPERMYVVAPWTGYAPQVFRYADYAAYYRCIRASLDAALDAAAPPPTYPEPVSHCDVCRWRLDCNDRRRADDHLSFVAGLSKLHTVELTRRGVTTLARLAAEPLPLAWKPERGSAKTYEALREQARIQAEGRAAGAPRWEPLPVEPERGLHRLPEPSPGDIFLDLEGDPFAGEGGQEYLFGYAWRDEAGALRYEGVWALTRAEEKAAFQRVMDFATERRARWPDLHIYHYAPYEPAAFKRLMGRYATREDALDAFLRGGVFVDLYAVARQAVRASVESYSIKKLEPFFGFVRAVELKSAGDARAQLEAALELGGGAEALTGDMMELVRGYNEDDCVSTAALRDWLETIRAQEIAKGAAIARPVPGEEAPSDDVSDWEARIAPVVAGLTADLPADRAERTLEQQGLWILANCLDWHRREEKAAWWEYFRLADLPPEELLDERAGLAGLAFVGEVEGGTPRCPIHRYRFVPQETDIRGGDKLRCAGGDSLGSVEAISFDELTIDIRKASAAAALHPEAAFAHDHVATKAQRQALLRIGESVLDGGGRLDGGGPYAAARDLLLRAPPGLGGAPIREPGETPLEAALRIAPLLDGGVLSIQGPPGAGKTYTGARMICALVRSGKKVGITANSHKVIRNLIDGVLKAAKETGVDLRCTHKPGDDHDEPDTDRLGFPKTNAALFAALADGACQVAGGTSWLWAREEAFETVDVLFVDEAAQMSLANVLAVSHAGKTVVMLGDPRQLDQPMKGSHPEGTDVSALQHMLGDAQIIGGDQGLFLDKTFRLHPRICAFNSQLFYEGKLESVAGRERQEVRSAAKLAGSGLRYVPVEHEGNQTASVEEAEAVARLVAGLLASRATWVDGGGQEKLLTLSDVVIITPYNAQIPKILERLARHGHAGARVGTVDKFQGQEAAVAIYSLACSSPEEAPRGLEFLMSPNRLNVAVSRGKCLSVLVASPRLFEAECKTPRQMKLANALCRFRELAETVELDAAEAAAAE